MTTAEQLLSKLLETTEKSIVPLTRTQVSTGSKLFGAAILSRASLAALTVATNNERASPLLHGEVHCIQQFFAAATTTTTTPEAARPATRDCIFFATHEPCSLCLSAITWSGFDEFYYLFTYEDSRDLFAIPHDLDILRAVYQVPAPGDTPATLAQRPLYNRTNKFFRARSLADVVATLDDAQRRATWSAEIARVKALYAELSETYQQGKRAGQQTSSVFQ